MTNKKRELIEILLDNVKPEDWPEELQFAAQDKDCHAIWFYAEKPTISTYKDRYSISNQNSTKRFHGNFDLCKSWDKTIVTRDEFVKRWNERNLQDCKKQDTEGWITWNGGEMPVEKGTLIDVKYRRGLVNLHVKAGEYPSGGSITDRCAIDFKHDDNLGDIIAYRLHAPQAQKTPQQLALEKFGTDWHENEGSCPVNNDVCIEIVLKNGAVAISKRENSTWSWDLSKGPWQIVKWRILGETNTITPPAQQEAHTEETKPIQQENIDAYEWPNKLKPSCSPMDRLLNELEKQSATDTQIGGNHYTKLAIQPMRYSMENGLDALQHTIIKYVTRFRDKNGIEDLEKAKHCVDMLIEFERDKK